jgi:MoxR-like ATPase
MVSDVKQLTDMVRQESAFIDDITKEVGKVIVGQTEMVERLLIGLLTGGHVLVEGVPGLAKTLMVRTLCSVIAAKFQRIQFTPDLLPADIVGTVVYNQQSGTFTSKKGPIFANLILADEINRATPKTQSALLEAMQEHSVTVANQTYLLDEPFFVLATQNPLEMEGTYPLPEAQLDRFMFKIDVLFPSSAELVEILDRTTGAFEAHASIATDGARVVQMGRLARKVPIPTHVSEYVARLVVATHPDSENPPDMVTRYVRYGSSPRGAQALILGAKISALLDGRYNVAFDDVKAVAPAALRHRLLLNFEGQAEGITTDAVIAQLLDKVPVG